MKDKKSTRLNSNVSIQSNRSTVLQAKLLPCYDSGKPGFKASIKTIKILQKHQISNIVFFRNFLVHLTSLLVLRTLQYVAKGKPQCRAKCIVNLCFLFFIRYVRNRIDHWCTVEPGNPNPQVHRSSGKLGEASFPTGTVDPRVGISLSPLNTNDGFSFDIFFSCGKN